MAALPTAASASTLHMGGAGNRECNGHRMCMHAWQACHFSGLGKHTTHLRSRYATVTVGNSSPSSLKRECSHSPNVWATERGGEGAGRMGACEWQTSSYHSTADTVGHLASPSVCSHEPRMDANRPAQQAQHAHHPRSA